MTDKTLEDTAGILSAAKNPAPALAVMSPGEVKAIHEIAAERTAYYEEPLVYAFLAVVVCGLGCIALAVIGEYAPLVIVGLVFLAATAYTVTQLAAYRPWLRLKRATTIAYIAQSQPL